MPAAASGGRRRRRGATPRRRRARYRLLSHTADLGVAAHGTTREELFGNAALGLTSAICPLRSIRATERFSVEARTPVETSEEADDAELLVAFLSEVLYRTCVDRLLVRRIAVTLPGRGRARGDAAGERIADRHPIQREVKAVTHHQARVWRDEGGWHGRVYLDI